MSDSSSSEDRVKLLAENDDTEERSNQSRASPAGDRLVTTIDGMLAEIGEFGLFQKLQYFHLSYTWIPSAIHTLNLVFVSPTIVPWQCKHSPDLTNSVCNSTEIHNSEDGMELLCRDVFETNEWEFVYPTHTVTAEFSLVCNESWKAPFLASIYFVGVGIGAVIFGTLSDKIGRRKTSLISLGAFMITAFSSAFCTGFDSYAAVRFLEGASQSGWGLANYALASEMIGARYRASAMTLNQGFFSVGEIILAGVAAAVMDWRRQTLICMLFFVPSLVAAVTILYESPRWLLSTGKKENALKVLRRAAQVNSKPFPKSELTEVKSQSQAEPFSRLFTNKILRHRQLVLMFGWFTCSLLYYGLSIAGSALTSDPYQDFVWQAVAELPGVVIAKYCLDWKRTGRRLSYAGSFALAGVACLHLVFLTNSPAQAQTALAFFGKLGITSAFTIAYVYPIELIPTSLRVRAMGICSVTARIGGIIAPFVGLVKLAGPAVPYIVFAVPAIIAAVSSATLPETRGRPLPQTSADLDSKSRRGFSMNDDLAHGDEVEDGISLSTLTSSSDHLVL